MLNLNISLRKFIIKINVVYEHKSAMGVVNKVAVSDS